MTDTTNMERKRERERVTFRTTKPSLAQQQFRDECDINQIMSRFEKTGVIEHLARYEGRYGDFIGYPDFQNAMEAVANATAMFMTLPSSIRERFNNDPEAFLQFAQDDDNIPELREMGLYPPERRRPDEGDVADAPAEPVPVERSETPAPE